MMGGGGGEGLVGMVKLMVGMVEAKGGSSVG